GLAFIASLVMIYFGINFLKGINIFKNKNTYIAVFEDVYLLNVSSPVYVQGYQIGLVNSVKRIGDNPMKFAVEINLEEGFRPSQGSSLEFGSDLFGASYVSLIMPPSTTYLEPGDTIPGTKKAGMMDGVAAVVPKADSILMHVDSVVLTLNALLSNPMWNRSIDGIGQTVQQLNRSSKSLNSLLGSLERDLPAVTHNLTGVSEDLKEVSQELSQLEMQKTFASIDETVSNLRSISGKINNDDSSLGMLLNTTQLHDSLTSTLDNATQLLEDIRKNPSRYLSIRLRLF
ncbi:MAG TPA: hypothetical protein DDZ78_16820, partial [Porphyromonadaceae bacterium]|nr:hypothetical protein [Porphyromonadaceae bacterium]